MGRATSQPGPGWALVRRSSPEKLPVPAGRAVTDGSPSRWRLDRCRRYPSATASGHRCCHHGGRRSGHGPGRRNRTMTGGDWMDETGLVALPGGARVRGRRLGDPASPADFALVLAGGPAPAWPHRRIRWPDFWVPSDPDDALDALHEAHRRAQRRRAGRGRLPRRGRPHRDRPGRPGRPRRPHPRPGRHLGPRQLPPAGRRDALAAALAPPGPLTPRPSPGDHDSRTVQACRAQPRAGNGSAPPR